MLKVYLLAQQQLFNPDFGLFMASEGSDLAYMVSCFNISSRSCIFELVVSGQSQLWCDSSQPSQSLRVGGSNLWQNDAGWLVHPYPFHCAHVQIPVEAAANHVGS